MNQHNPLSTSDPDPEPRPHYEVHCGRCKWWGYKKQLRTGIAYAGDSCPVCHSEAYLEYMNSKSAEQVYLAYATAIKAEKSPDYCLGFDTGVALAVDYFKELLECPNYLPTKSEDAS